MDTMYIVLGVCAVGLPQTGSSTYINIHPTIHRVRARLERWGSHVLSDNSDTLIWSIIIINGVLHPALRDSRLSMWEDIHHIMPVLYSEYIYH